MKRGLVVYIMGALRGKESVSTKGRIMESFIKECKRAALVMVNYTIYPPSTFENNPEHAVIPVEIIGFPLE